MLRRPSQYQCVSLMAGNSQGLELPLTESPRSVDITPAARTRQPVPQGDQGIVIVSGAGDMRPLICPQPQPIQTPTSSQMSHDHLRTLENVCYGECAQRRFRTCTIFSYGPKLTHYRTGQRQKQRVEELEELEQALAHADNSQPTPQSTSRNNRDRSQRCSNRG